MKRILLAPYPGVICLARTWEELSREHKRRTGRAYHRGTENGVTITLSKKGYSDDYLVYAKKTSTLAHEFGHVLLRVFHTIGAHPADGNGEPFCYMLSHLMVEAGKR